MSRFTGVQYDETACAGSALFTDVFERLADMIEVLPNGREKSLALTKLEESHMWVGKVIRDDQIARSKS